MTGKVSRRLGQLTRSLGTVPDAKRNIEGTVTLYGTSVPVYSARDEMRLPKTRKTLDISGETAADVYFLLQKWVLGQDIFLYGSPGPYGRRLALTFCRMLNLEYEYVALHRDIGETELKQGREIREGGTLEYVDSPAVRAAKEGRVLILDGIERCERGILPILNNLLENREINLEDGTHIVSSSRYDLMQRNNEDTRGFIPAHDDFRVIAIGVPVPPYTGASLDPPFRSRFQGRYIDGIGSAKALAANLIAAKHEDAFLDVLEAKEAAHGKETAENEAVKEITAQSDTASQQNIARLNRALASLELLEEISSSATEAIGRAGEKVPRFPQTALAKLSAMVEAFGTPDASAGDVLVLLLNVHPGLGFSERSTLRKLEQVLGKEDFSWDMQIADVDRWTFPNDGTGLFGWAVESIDKTGNNMASVTFGRAGSTSKKTFNVPCGSKELHPFEPLEGTLWTARFLHLLSVTLQWLAVGEWDVLYVPRSNTLQTASTSSQLLVDTVAALLGYDVESVHLYKELGGRELWMRRVVREGTSSVGATAWEPAPLVRGAWAGKLVHLEGIDTLGPTASSLARFVSEREAELWEGRRIVGSGGDGDIYTQTHPSFRVIATATKASPPKEWLTEDLSGMFAGVSLVAMQEDEEKKVLEITGAPQVHIDHLLSFARAYRTAHAQPGSKANRLSTGMLVRIARRLAVFPDESLYRLLTQALLSEFSPLTARMELHDIITQCGIKWFQEPQVGDPVVKENALVFAQGPREVKIPRYDISKDPLGASHVPYMGTFLNNHLQSALMRDMATDLFILGDHCLLLGNQGVGKNKITDRLLQLLGRPREYIQLHRDSTVQSLMFQTSLQRGVIRYIDSPLLRAVRHGRVMVIDEADKAPEHVVAVLVSLATRGEMTLADGRKIIPPGGQMSGENDIVVNGDFRMVLLANRPGFPFLGNAFLRVLGSAFSSHAVPNPDLASEELVLRQLAPELDESIIHKLVLAFADLRKAFEDGSLNYPYSLRELLALVKHMKHFPRDSLEQALRNVFDFDVNRPEAISILRGILAKHRLPIEKVGIDAVRDAVKAQELAAKENKDPVIEFKPSETDLKAPKYGKEDDKQHVGGNTWAGGTGGRDTAGLGGRGGYMRLYKGHAIHQIDDELKKDVPPEIEEQARQMAQEELAKRLAEIDLSAAQAGTYTQFYKDVEAHINKLVTFLENLAANEDERVWVKRQTDGELDESRLADGLTGDMAIYKRRGTEKPDPGRPQVKPKRIRLIFDLSASMYRNQFDGRLTRSLEAAVLIFEAFARLTRKEKYAVDVVGQSGEDKLIPLVSLGTWPNHPGERYKILQKMVTIPQFTWPGDNTIESIEEGVSAVSEADADDFFLISITDANFSRYGITSAALKKALNKNAKVKGAIIAIGEGADAVWLPRDLPGQGFRVIETKDIALVLQDALSKLLAPSAM